MGPNRDPFEMRNVAPLPGLCVALGADIEFALRLWRDAM
jgi:hypothetical protein